MKVYVVIEEDRGMGPMVLGVFPGTPAGKSKAEQVGSGWHCNIEEAELDLEDDEPSLGEK